MKPSTSNGIAKEQESHHLTALLHKHLLKICKRHFRDAAVEIEIDCTVCISRQNDHLKERVVQIHEVLDSSENELELSSQHNSCELDSVTSDFEEPVDLTDRNRSSPNLNEGGDMKWMENGEVGPANGTSEASLDVKSEPNSSFLGSPDGNSNSDDATVKFENPCTVCKLNFQDVSELQQHIASHFPLMLPCPKCGKMFGEVPQLRWHLAHVHQDTISGHACHKCEMLFADKLEYAKHTCFTRLETVEKMDDHMAPASVESCGSSSSQRFESKERSEAADSRYASPNPASDGAMGVAGSRKRKNQNPMKHIRHTLMEDENDALYFNSSAEKKLQQAKVGTQSRNASYVAVPSYPLDFSRQRSKTPPLVSIKPRDDMYTGSTPEIVKKISPQYFMHIPGSIQPKPLSRGITNSPFSPGRNFTSPVPIMITPQLDNNFHVPSRPHVEELAQESQASRDAADSTREFACTEAGCNEIIVGFSVYEDHCMTRHGRYPCKYCKQTFSGKNNRTRHMRCHIGSKTYTCPDCNKNFSRPDSMREHQFIHTLSYQEDKCRTCGASFDKKNLLLAHLKQCYRHKMETGKSTKLIDESPSYHFKDDLSVLKNDVVPYYESATSRALLLDASPPLPHLASIKPEPLDLAHNSPPASRSSSLMIANSKPFTDRVNNGLLKNSIGTISQGSQDKSNKPESSVVDFRLPLTSQLSGIVQFPSGNTHTFSGVLLPRKEKLPSDVDVLKRSAKLAAHGGNPVREITLIGASPKLNGLGHETGELARRYTVDQNANEPLPMDGRSGDK